VPDGPRVSTAFEGGPEHLHLLQPGIDLAQALRQDSAHALPGRSAPGRGRPATPRALPRPPCSGDRRWAACHRLAQDPDAPCALIDCEEYGPLDGLKLVGFAVWERRTGGRNVTIPARQYSVNGERRSFALLRPIVDASSQDRLRELILDAYREHEAAVEAASA
jgi:hypothetical protein